MSDGLGRIKRRVKYGPNGYISFTSMTFYDENGNEVMSEDESYYDDSHQVMVRYIYDHTTHYNRITTFYESGKIKGISRNMWDHVEHYSFTENGNCKKIRHTGLPPRDTSGNFIHEEREG